jgi:hypothetical protein
MVKLSQTELLQEGFLDAVRAAGRGVANAAAYAKRIDTEGFGVLKDPLKKFITNNPVLFLKEELKKDPKIQFVKLVKSSLRPVTTQSASLSSSSYKNVTLITFLANVYNDETGQYEPYTESQERVKVLELTMSYNYGTSATSPNTTRTNNAPVTNPNTTSQQPVSGNGGPNTLLLAEVFRVDKGSQQSDPGFILGGIYDARTGRKISAGEDTNRVKNFDQELIQFKQRRLRGASLDVGHMITFLQSIGISNNAPKAFGIPNVTDLATLIQNITSKVAPDTLTDDEVNNIKAILVQRLLVESVRSKQVCNRAYNTSQKVLLEQLKNL